MVEKLVERAKKERLAALILEYLGTEGFYQITKNLLAEDVRWQEMYPEFLAEKYSLFRLEYQAQNPRIFMRRNAHI